MSFTSQRLKRYWFRMLLFVLLAALGVLFTMATALSVADFLKLLFNDSTIPTTPNQGNLVAQGLESLYVWLIAFGQRKAIIYFSLLVFASYTLKNVFTYFAAVEMSIIRSKVVRDVRNEMFQKSMSLNMSYYTTTRKGDMLSRFGSDMVEYEENVINSIQTLVNSVVNLLLYLSMLFYINIKLSLFVLCMLPVVAFVISGITRHLRRTSEELQERGSLLMSLMEETMMGLKIIKAYTAIDFSNRRFRIQNKSYTDLRVKVYRRVDMASPVSDFLGNVIVIGILLFGSHLVMSGDNGLTAELFISFIMMFVLMISPAKELTTAISQIKKGRGCEERLSQLLQGEEENRGGDLVFDGLKESIEFRNLNFSYGTVTDGERKEVLTGINLTIPRGRKVALVGSSGSGKSTLADLVSRFYAVDRGQLLVDGKPISDYSLSSLRQHIGVVAQDTLLFNDTVSANIAFGMEGATFGQIVAAAKVANAHDFIEKLPQGYDTNIGDKGDCLSGGQRQRLSIARTVLRHPDILILDEATSALDTESERLVQQALDQVLEGRTAIIIAHRLSTIKNVDEIVVLEQGTIIERGTHAQLMDKGGRYKELVDLQQLVR